MRDEYRETFDEDRGGYGQKGLYTRGLLLVTTGDDSEGVGGGQEPPEGSGGRGVVRGGEGTTDTSGAGRPPQASKRAREEDELEEGELEEGELEEGEL